MGKEEFNKELITYLYDEMSSEDRQRFEKVIESDPELRKEFEDLRDMRKGLSHIGEKEVMEPFFLWDKHNVAPWTTFIRKRSLLMFKPFIAVAASLSIFLLIGYFTNFSISYQDSSLRIGFNQINNTNQNLAMSQDDIAKMVNQEIAKNNAYIFTKLSETENSVNTRFASLEKDNSTSKGIQSLPEGLVTEKDLDTFLTQTRNNNVRVLQSYLESSSVQQQEYFQAVITEFSNYVETQRTEDLRMIRRSLLDLQENQQSQKQETDQILASILSTVNTQNN